MRSMFVQPCVPLRRLFGLPVLDMDWDGALAFLEGYLATSRQRLTVSFLDESAALRQLVDPAYRNLLSHRTMLPAAGAPLRAWERLTRKGSAPTHFSAKRFVPAFLTFLAEGRRVAIVGEEASDIERLREELSIHTPWHEIVAIAASELAEYRDDVFDMVLVQASSPAEEQRIEAQLSSLRASLVMMVGAGLAGFIAEKPAFRARVATAPIEASAAA